MREWSWGLWMRGRGEGWVVGGWGRRRAGIAFVGGLHRACVSLAWLWSKPVVLGGLAFLDKFY